ncbi:predicted protein, partial [Nematostella vectensis]
LGMESRAIRNSAITASSYRYQGVNTHSVPHYGRLNNVGQLGVSMGAWIAENQQAGEYLEIDLGSVMVVVGVATQGRPGGSDYVTSYKISHKTDLTTWLMLKEGGQEKVFSGNSDHYTPVFNWFPSPILARRIRIIVQDFQGLPALRAELYGCI